MHERNETKREKEKIINFGSKYINTYAYLCVYIYIYTNRTEQSNKDFFLMSRISY